MSQLALDTSSGAVFSPCRTWRYALYRVWDPATPPAMFIGLNPSTADETTDDNTIRRCTRFARDWGYGGLTMTNLYGFRATQPHALWAAEKAGLDTVGPENDLNLLVHAESAGIVVAAWGTKAAPWRVEQVLKLLGGMGLQALRLTQDGHPNHPLYLPAGLTPQPWCRA